MKTKILAISSYSPRLDFQPLWESECHPSMDCGLSRGWTSLAHQCLYLLLTPPSQCKILYITFLLSCIHLTVVYNRIGSLTNVPALSQEKQHRASRLQRN